MTENIIESEYLTDVAQDAVASYMTLNFYGETFTKYLVKADWLKNMYTKEQLFLIDYLITDLYAEVSHNYGIETDLYKRSVFSAILKEVSGWIRIPYKLAKKYYSLDRLCGEEYRSWCNRSEISVKPVTIRPFDNSKPVWQLKYGDCKDP